MHSLPTTLTILTPDQPELWETFKTNCLAMANQIDTNCAQKFLKEFVAATEVRFWENKSGQTTIERR